MCKIGFWYVYVARGIDLRLLNRVMTKTVYIIYKQRRHRSACSSALSDQRLKYSLPRWYNYTYGCYIRLGYCYISWVDRFAQLESRVSQDLAHYIPGLSAEVNHFVVPSKPVVGQNFTLHYNITASSNDVNVVNVQLGRKRSNDAYFNDIVLFDGTSRNITYLDSTLIPRTTAKNSFEHVGSSEDRWTLSLTFIDAHCNDSGQYKWIKSYDTILFKWNAHGDKQLNSQSSRKIFRITRLWHYNASWNYPQRTHGTSS